MPNVDVQKLLSAPGITTKVVGEQGSVTIHCEPNPPFRFYAVGDRPDDGNQVFISSFNVRCASGSIAIDEKAVPFGGEGGVIFRKNGSGEIWQTRVLRSQEVQDSIPKDQAEDVGWR